MNRLLSCFLIGLGCSLSAALGQHSKVEPVKAEHAKRPFIAKVPEGAEWTVTYKYAWDIDSPKLPTQGTTADPSAPANKSRTIVSYRGQFSKGILREDTKFSDQSEEWRYIFKGLIASQDANRAIVIESVGAVYDSTPFRPTEFNDFNWISAENFIGEADYQGTLCNVYREMLALPGGNADPKAIVRTAFVDKTTRLPVGLEDAMGIRLYQFKGTGANVQLPAEVIAALKERAAIAARYKMKYDIRQ